MSLATDRAIVLELSHFIREGMPVYPGTEPPLIVEANTLEADGFREKLITMYSHTGTHMDAPAHILPGAPTLDSMSPDCFLGVGFLLDVSAADGSEIGLNLLEAHRESLENSDFLLLRTGWDRFWGEPAYFQGYPVLEPEAAQWIASQGLKGVGFDCISADPADSRELPIHRILLKAGMLIIENLTGLDQLPEGTAGVFDFMALPLRIENADGSPVRALAIAGREM